MKKIFTLISMALVAMSVNAQNIEDIDSSHLYEIESITWKPITWKNGNNKKDKDNNDMFFLMGTGNGYEKIMAEEIYTDGEPTGNYRAAYSYTKYEEGATGTPIYGLYYKFEPKISGTLKVNVWVNKGNRNTFIIKGSTGAPYGTMFVDYSLDGYINGQNTPTSTPIIDEETGEQKLDNDGNPMWVVAPTYFDNAGVQAKHQERVDAGTTTSTYALFDNQAFWGWLTFAVQAGESYYVFQQSSQLGFGGYEFEDETYVASPEGGLAAEFAAVVDASGNATNVTSEGSVVVIDKEKMKVTAVGGAEPESVTPKSGSNAIQTVKAAESDAPVYNLAGQRVNSSAKGLLIKNGRKVVK